MKRLVMYRHVDNATGYGISANRLTVELVKLGIDVVVRPTVVSEMFGATIPVEVKSRIVSRVQTDDLELVFHPSELPPTPGKITAYFTMGEASRLRDMAVKNLNESELVIVPSHWGAACFSAQGVKTDIKVVPLGCTPAFEPMPRRDKFVFAAAGRMAHGGTRKGIEMVVDCFKAAFTGDCDDVRLNLKIFPDCKLPDPQDARISVTRAYLSDSQMHRWMADANCFVSAAKGEGFGLHQIEALATGRPVIAAIYGGTAEFMNKHNSFPVKFLHKPADGYYEGLGNLIEIDEFDMAAQMWNAYSNRDECERKGWIGFQDVRHLTWQNSARMLLDVLEESGAI